MSDESQARAEDRLAEMRKLVKSQYAASDPWHHELLDIAEGLLAENARLENDLDSERDNSNSLNADCVEMQLANDRLRADKLAMGVALGDVRIQADRRIARLRAENERLRRVVAFHAEADRESGATIARLTGKLAEARATQRDWLDDDVTSAWDEGYETGCDATARSMNGETDEH